MYFFVIIEIMQKEMSLEMLVYTCTVHVSASRGCVKFVYGIASTLYYELVHCVLLLR